MKTIELVVHVYAEDIEAYARMWTAQLSSMILWYPECKPTVTVWTTETDKLVRKVADQLAYDCDNCPDIRIRTLPKKELFRRSIGRNISAKNCSADIMWFLDCDYLFGPGCLDTLAQFDFDSIKPHEMVFPGSYQMMLSHAHGDAEIERIVPGELFVPDLKPYFKKRLKLGIGGLQIVPRDVAHRGYLGGTKWCKPRADERPFPDTDDDARYRRTIHSSIPIAIPNLYRIRHSEASYETPESRKLRMSAKPRPGNQ